MPRKSKPKTEPSARPAFDPEFATICVECTKLCADNHVECTAHPIDRDLVTGKWYYEHACLVNNGQCPDFERIQARTVEVVPPDRTHILATIWLTVLIAVGMMGWIYWSQIREWLGL